MKKEYQNYLFIVMGFMVLFIMYLFHFLKIINNILIAYNKIGVMRIWFLGNGWQDLNIVVDLCFFGIIFLIFMMVFLKIYWGVDRG